MAEKSTAVASNKTIYQITVLNFDKYNSNLKKGHKCVLVSTGFLTDSKVRQLSPAGKLLFLSCILVAGDLTTSQYDVTHESLCYQSGVKSGSLQSQLDQLQSLQLLTFEKNESLIKRREDKGIESKVIEKNIVIFVTEFSFADAFQLYPIQKKGPNAEARFRDQIKTQSLFDDLIKSIHNYKTHLSLPQNAWRLPKQTFAAYLGTKSSGFFWTDWVNHAEPVNVKDQPIAAHLNSQYQRLIANKTEIA